MGEARVPRHGPGIRIESSAPASRHLHGRLVARVLAAPLTTALVAAGPADNLTGPATGADRDGQR
jgi:hypothetical protein